MIHFINPLKMLTTFGKKRVYDLFRCVLKAQNKYKFPSISSINFDGDFHKAINIVSVNIDHCV